MSRTPPSGFALLLRLLLLVIAAALTTYFVESADRQQSELAQLDQLQGQLRQVSARLQRTLRGLVEINEEAARQIAPTPDIAPARLLNIAGRAIDGRQHIVDLTLARGLRVDFVYPLQGNEAVLGMDYGVRPDLMRAVRQSVEARGTQLSGPAMLVQSGRLAVFVRTPLYATPEARQAGRYWGFVSLAADLAETFREAGIDLDRAPYLLALRQREDDGAFANEVFGEAQLFRGKYVAVEVDLFGSRWELAAAPKLESAPDTVRVALIRGIGVVLTLVLLVALVLDWRRRQVDQGQLSGLLIDSMRARGGLFGKLPLRTFLLGSILLILLPAIVLTGWVSYRSAQQTAAEYGKALAWEMGGRIRDQVVAFFDVPRQVVAFNVEQARAGLLDTQKREELMRRFLLQIRQQPLLTFVSMGMSDGEYYAGSRPPFGGDRGLRMVQARKRDGMAMQALRVDHNGLPATRVAVGRPGYDARDRPWYKMALHAGGITWYPAYRYVVPDPDGAYDTLGIGMAAPLYDAQGRLLGVTTADVALSQLNDFLERLGSATQSVAFLVEQDGTLLATSERVPLYHGELGRIYRHQLRASTHPLLQAAGRVIGNSGGPVGNVQETIGGQNYLINWQSYALPQGPRLIMGVVLAEPQFQALAGGMLRNTLYLVLAIALFSLLLGVLSTNWVVRPLSELSRRAAALAAGRWQRGGPPDSPVEEVAALSGAIDDMAQQLQRYTLHLEQLVTERTAQLEVAESERRYLLSVASHEFRTPAAQIKASLDSLRFLADSVPPEVASRLENIRLAALRLNDLSNTLLTQERLSNPAMLFKEAQVDLVALIRDALERYPAAAGLVIDLPGEVVRLDVDPTQLRIAVQNLVDNALEHNRPSLGPVRVFLEATGERLEIGVADHGSGIPDSEKAQVFQRFHNQRGHFTRGVGLAIVARVAENHGGQAWVRDNAPCGTTMVISLPKNG